MDGVTLGHPRCNVRRCTHTLRSPRDRFCPEHQALANQCAIDGCIEPVVRGFRTCTLPAHRQYETRQRGLAIHRLKKRAEQAGLRAATAAQARTAPVDLDILDDPEAAQELGSEPEDSTSHNIDSTSCAEVLDRVDVAEILADEPWLYHSEANKQARQ